ncbi:tetratricopeptide repeat protein [Streptomyces sp. NPDC007916]|uniref:tetratricopeptide repeat protein n=1 Tax=Streptomyces sp. NPDC007916 TaxID=3364792 RepID=UPI0036EFD50B
MTRSVPGTTGGGVHGNTFHGPAAVQSGANGTQHIQIVYQWKPAYRIEGFPAASRPSARLLAEQPSRLLRGVHEVVPFTGRDDDLGELARWRDDPAEMLSIRLVHGPGGQGKTRLAAHFAGMSRAAGWTVWQAVVNETGADPVTASPPPETATGILLVVDYAERWPTPDLRRLLQEPLWRRTGIPVRVLLLARPAGIWWESLETWIGDRLNIPAEAHPLPPLADDPSARAARFCEARDCFADHLGLAPAEASRIGPPLDLDINEDYAQILTIHIAALAAVDAYLHHDPTPTDPARASAYLIRRERTHWSTLHQRLSQPLSTDPDTMGRLVLTATLTRPLARTHAQAALDQMGLADSNAAANTLLDDHRYCYPPPHANPAHTVTVLEPLYPDRLGEDFIGLITPASPNDQGILHPVPGAATDYWFDRAAEQLLSSHTSTNPDAALPWTRDALTVLIETSRRWPHIATGQLYPLLKKHPELAMHAGGTALAALASLDTIDLTVLEAIEPHLPTSRHTDLDVGIAAIGARLARHRLVTTHDPATRAHILDTLAVRQVYAGLRNEALTTGQDALRAWRDLTRTNPAHQPDLAASLSNLGNFLSEVGRREEALTATQEAVETQRRLAAGNPAAYEPDLAASLAGLGARLSEVGRREEALTATQEAADVYRRLAAGNPAAHEPDLAASLAGLGARLSEVGRREEALTATQGAADVYRRLAAGNPAAHEPDLAASLAGLGAVLSKVGRQSEALTATQEAVEIQRRLAAGSPTAHEPALATSLAGLGARLSEVGRQSEALTATQEAVEIQRRLAAGNPAAYEPDLATSLSNLGAVLSKVGRREEALTATQEAADVYRRLAAGNPAAHEPDLAASLSNLSIRLLEAERRGEALTSTEEAVEVYSRLAVGNPAAYEPALAASLSNLGNFLSEVGRREEALTATQEAVEIRRRLAVGNPAAYEPDLATSLFNLGIRLSEVGRRGEALTSIEEAVEIQRRLAVGNPAAYEPDLAASLSNLGALLSNVGRRGEALTAEQGAVEIWRKLAAGNPAAYEPALAASLSTLASILAVGG